MLHHVVLRRMLSRNKILPFHLDSFNDEMSERIILRRVGGGWVFIHRYLLEHFAAGFEENGTGVNSDRN